MEIRLLKYFLAVVREQNISKAAEYLHTTQPNLSRQIQALEQECGQQLFVKANRKMNLTEAGVLLRKRAEEIVELADKTETELADFNAKEITGEIYVGSGESTAIEVIAKAIKSIQLFHPQIKINIISGDAKDVFEKLDKGLIDIGVLFEPVDFSKYNYMRMPQKDTWGFFMRKDSPLAKKDYIEPKDLWDKPLMFSRQTIERSYIIDWMKKPMEELNIVARYNLIYNASILVKEGMGYALGLEGLINTTGDSELVFKRLKPNVEASLIIIWKKYQILSRPVQMFIDKLREIIGETGQQLEGVQA